MGKGSLRLTEEQLREFLDRGLRASRAAAAASAPAERPKPVPQPADQRAPRKRSGATPESAVLRLTYKALKAHPKVEWCVRLNTGVFSPGGERTVRCGWVGASDIIGQMTTGEFLSIECKAPGKKPTVEQSASLERIARAGGCAGWVDDPALIYGLIDRWVEHRTSALRA